MNHSVSRLSSPAFSEKQAQLAARLGLLWAIVLSLVYGLGVFDEVEESIVDGLQMLPGPSMSSNALALIDIAHIPSDRPWPWPRLDYALIMRGLVPQAPQSVVFEMLLHDKDARFSAFDTTFADQVERTNHVLFSAAALRLEGDEPRPSNLKTLSPTGGIHALASFGSFFWPQETFSRKGEVGISNLSAEKNQNLRTVSLLFRYKEEIVPSLALSAAAIDLGAELNQTTYQFGHELLLRNAEGRILRRIPIDNEGRLRLRFRPHELIFPSVNYENLLLAADQIERGVAREVELQPLRGRQVWVAATDRNVVPLISTVNGPLPPVKIHMLATQQILAQDYVLRIPTILCAFLFVATGILLARIFITSGLRPAILSLATLTGLIGFLAVIVFELTNLVFPLATFVVHMGGILLCGMAARHWEFRSPAAEDEQMPLGI